MRVSSELILSHDLLEIMCYEEFTLKGSRVAINMMFAPELISNMFVLACKHTALLGVFFEPAGTRRCDESFLHKSSTSNQVCIKVKCVKPPSNAVAVLRQ